MLSLFHSCFRQLRWLPFFVLEYHTVRYLAYEKCKYRCLFSYDLPTTCVYLTHVECKFCYCNFRYCNFRYCNFRVYLSHDNWSICEIVEKQKMC